MAKIKNFIQSMLSSKPIHYQAPVKMKPKSTMREKIFEEKQKKYINRTKSFGVGWGGELPSNVKIRK